MFLSQIDLITSVRAPPPPARRTDENVSVDVMNNEKGVDRALKTIAKEWGRQYVMGREGCVCSGGRLELTGPEPHAAASFDELPFVTASEGATAHLSVVSMGKNTSFSTG